MGGTLPEGYKFQRKVEDSLCSFFLNQLLGFIPLLVSPGFPSLTLIDSNGGRVRLDSPGKAFTRPKPTELEFEPFPPLLSPVATDRVRNLTFSA